MAKYSKLIVAAVGDMPKANTPQKRKLEEAVKRACACLYSPDEEEAFQAKLFLEKVKDKLEDVDSPTQKQLELLNYVKEELDVKS